MLFKYLLAAALVVCPVRTEEDPDEELSRPTRVVHGEPVPDGIAGWQVSVQMKYMGNHFCGGSLIAPRWVLTANHCTLEKDAEDIRVGLGNNKVDKITTFYNVAEIIRHEFYNTTTLVNDIALLRLDNVNDVIPRGIAAETISLEDDEDLMSRNCFVTGFGRLSLGGEKASRLMEAQVPLYSYTACRGIYPSNYYITQGHVCAGGEDKDACQGDSGGPLVCCEDSKLTTAAQCKLVGVTTWGIGCANVGTPGVYTKVAHYKDWITAKMEGAEYMQKEFRDKGGWNLFQQFHNLANMVPF